MNWIHRQKLFYLDIEKMVNWLLRQQEALAHHDGQVGLGTAFSIALVRFFIREPLFRK